MKHYSFSKRLHWATLCCFLFPFFYTGCRPEAEEKAAIEKAKQDSIIIAESQQITQGDSLPATDTIPPVITVAPAVSQADTTNDQLFNPSDKPEDLPTSRIIKKFPFLKPVLSPTDETSTGLAIAIDSSVIISFCAIFISLLLLILSLVVKYIDAAARKTIVLLEACALIFILISQPISFNLGSKTLWGLWAAAAFIVVLTAYDLYLVIIQKRQQQIQPAT